jgi:hypothetical protein
VFKGREFAKNIRALAAAIAGPELPAETLEATINKWNEFFEAGVDGKPIKRLYSADSLGHTHGQVYNMWPAQTIANVLSGALFTAEALLP